MRPDVLKERILSKNWIRRKCEHWTFHLRRAVKFWWQRRTRGFDDSDLWSLDYTIAKFALPRLIEFRKNICGFPGNMSSAEEWGRALDDMIYAMGQIVEDCASMRDDERATRGMDMFHRYFRALWR